MLLAGLQSKSQKFLKRKFQDNPKNFTRLQFQFKVSLSTAKFPITVSKLVGTPEPF